MFWTGCEPSFVMFLPSADSKKDSARFASLCTYFAVKTWNFGSVDRSTPMKDLLLDVRYAMRVLWKSSLNGPSWTGVQRLTSDAKCNHSRLAVQRFPFGTNAARARHS